LGTIRWTKERVVVNWEGKGPALGRKEDVNWRNHWTGKGGLTQRNNEFRPCIAEENRRIKTHRKTCTKINSSRLWRPLSRGARVTRRMGGFCPGGEMMKRKKINRIVLRYRRKIWHEGGVKSQKDGGERGSEYLFLGWHLIPLV